MARVTRVQAFKEFLERDAIDLNQLREMCFQGAPDEGGNRALAWRLLLDYLPPKRSEWDKHLKRQREVYAQFIEEMVVGGTTGHSPDDHPLNPSPESWWQMYFKDNDVLLQIDKDVRRLCPDMSFFQQPTEFPNSRITDDPTIESLRQRVERTVLKSANVTRNRLGVTNILLSKKRANEDYARLPEGKEAHWEVVERILFIYAKLNPGLAYVQGMNEIIGPIYFTFASDPNLEWKEHAEADSFFCFTNLMARIRDFFLKTLDDSACGIGAMMQRLVDKVKQHDPAVHHRLEVQELRPQFYAFRWITLMLSQEFPLPDVMRIWDSVFAELHSDFEFLICVCCAMILLIRDNLLSGDFPANMKLLQNFPEMDINNVLGKAVTIYERPLAKAW